MLMGKLYTERECEYSLKKLEPRHSTLEFILNYSKSVDVIETKDLGLTFLIKN